MFHSTLKVVGTSSGTPAIRDVCVLGSGAINLIGGTLTHLYATNYITGTAGDQGQERINFKTMLHPHTLTLLSKTLTCDG